MTADPAPATRRPDEADGRPQQGDAGRSRARPRRNDEPVRRRCQDHDRGDQRDIDRRSCEPSPPGGRRRRRRARMVEGRDRSGKRADRGADRPRKAALDGEMEAHAFVVRARIERVDARVATYRTEWTNSSVGCSPNRTPLASRRWPRLMPEPPSLPRSPHRSRRPSPTPFQAGAPGRGFPSRRDCSAPRRAGSRRSRR